MVLFSFFLFFLVLFWFLYFFFSFYISSSSFGRTTKSCDTCHYFVTCELSKTCHYFETWERRRPVPVLQVPAGEEGGAGGFPNPLKEEEQEED